MTAVDDYTDDIEKLAYEKDDARPSGLSQLVTDVETRVAEPTRLRHPGMPEYTLSFRSHIESAEAMGIEKRTKNSKAQVRDRNALFLAVVNTGIERDGAPVENSKGEPVTFRDPEFLDALGAKTAAQGVVKFLQGNDGYLIAVADLVAKKAGYGTEVEEVADPT
jgi:hypothetical protein